jgi:hypothetical protein
MPDTYRINDKPKLVYSPTLDDVPTDATVVLTVTAPDGTTTTPTPVHAGTGVYEAEFEVTMAGNWVWKWKATGTVVDVEDGWLIVEAPVASDMYASVAELRARFRLEDADDDEMLTKAIRAASRHIDDMCNRRFYADSTATARIYYPRDCYRVDVDDLWTTTGLVVKLDDGTNTFPTTVAAADYQLEPLNGVVSGASGWPYDRIRLIVANVGWPSYWNRRASVQVTAKWGWAAVPAPVRDACLVESAELFRTKDAPFGIRTGDFGAIRVRPNPKVDELITAYKRNAVLVA